MNTHSYIWIFVIIVLKDTYCVSTRCAEDDGLTPTLTVSELNILLDRNQSFIDIEVNETLHLKCEGIESIVWKSSDFDLSSNPYQKYITLNDNVIDGKHISELSVSPIIYRLIGLYSCHYKRGFIPKKAKLTQNNSIYVFVTDPQHLFAKNGDIFSYEEELDLEPIKVIPNHEVRICRPTSSLTRMSLWRINRWKMFDTIEQTIEYFEMSVGSQYGIEFDSRHGFIINGIDSRIDKIKCVAMLNNTKQAAIKDLFYPNPLKYEPVIIGFNKTTFVVGDNFTLDCQIRRNDDEAKDENVDIDWNFNGQCFRDQPSAMSKGTLKSNLSSNGTVSYNYESMSVTVVDAQLSDSGVYECSAGYFSGIVGPDKSVSVTIQVNEA